MSTATQTPSPLPKGATRAEAVVAAAVQLFRDDPLISEEKAAGVLEELRIIALGPPRLVVARAAPNLIEIAAAMILLPMTRRTGFEILGIATLAMTDIKLIDIFGEEGWRLARPIELLLTTLAPVWPLVCEPEDEWFMMDLSMTIILVARTSAFFGFAPVTLAIDKEVWVPRLTAFLEVVPQNEHRKEMEECMRVLGETIEVTRRTLQDAKDKGETETLKGLMLMHTECQQVFSEYLDRMRKTLDEIKRMRKEREEEEGGAANTTEPQV